MYLTPTDDYFDTPPPPMPLHGVVMAGFHASLGRTRFRYFESYVEALCRYCTAEKAADRMHWNYELPSDHHLKGWFSKLHGKKPALQ